MTEYGYRTRLLIGGCRASDTLVQIQPSPLSELVVVFEKIIMKWRNLFKKCQHAYNPQRFAGQEIYEVIKMSPLQSLWYDFGHYGLVVAWSNFKDVMSRDL